jgi:hypothetical protein
MVRLVSILSIYLLYAKPIKAQQQRLFSSSFGYPGADATYDYVGEFAIFR